MNQTYFECYEFDDNVVRAATYKSNVVVSMRMNQCTQLNFNIVDLLIYKVS